jgi:hypothetical protein
MDAERLAAIRARVEQATPGPWHAYIGVNTGLWVVDQVLGPIVCSNLGPDRNRYSGPNADFIASAREDVPDLLAEVERLTAENQRLTSEFNLARGRFEGAVMAARWERATTGESR